MRCCFSTVLIMLYRRVAVMETKGTCLLNGRLHGRFAYGRSPGGRKTVVHIETLSTSVGRARWTMFRRYSFIDLGCHLQGHWMKNGKLYDVKHAIGGLRYWRGSVVMRRVFSSLSGIFFVVFVPPCICPQTRPLLLRSVQRNWQPKAVMSLQVTVSGL